MRFYLALVWEDWRWQRGRHFLRKIIKQSTSREVNWSITRACIFPLLLRLTQSFIHISTSILATLEVFQQPLNLRVLFFSLSLHICAHKNSQRGAPDYFYHLYAALNTCFFESARMQPFLTRRHQLGALCSPLTDVSGGANFHEKIPRMLPFVWASNYGSRSHLISCCDFWFQIRTNADALILTCRLHQCSINGINQKW